MDHNEAIEWLKGNRSMQNVIPQDPKEEKEITMWKNYRKTAIQEMRPYIPGEDLSGVSVSKEDTPEPGGMIARNSKNLADQWYVAKDFFEENYEEADTP